MTRLSDAGRTNIERIDAELDEMELPADLDAALLVRFHHDLFWLPTPDDLLANPDDTRDWNIFADGAARRDKTDRFVFKFVKPR